MKESRADRAGSLAEGAQRAEADFHVATNGNDTWSGKRAQANEAGTDGPFASVRRARDAVRELKKEPGGLKQPVMVQMRGGVYSLKECLTFGPEDQEMIFSFYIVLKKGSFISGPIIEKK